MTVDFVVDRVKRMKLVLVNVDLTPLVVHSPLIVNVVFVVAVLAVWVVVGRIEDLSRAT